MKTTYVIFTNNLARIFVNPDDELLRFYKADPNAIIMRNPVKVNLKGVPKHLWKPDVEHNEIWPLDGVVSEQSRSYADIPDDRVKREPQPIDKVMLPKFKLNWVTILAVTNTIEIVLLITYLIVKHH